MSRDFVDLNSNDTFNWWTLRFYLRPKRAIEWPKWLTCPEHYMGIVQDEIDERRRLVAELRKGPFPNADDIADWLEEHPREIPAITEDLSPGSSITEKSRRATIRAEERFELSVRDTNNLARFLYTNGWISHEQHPDIHVLLDEMIAWLEQRGIKVDMDMKRME